MQGLSQTCRDCPQKHRDCPHRYLSPNPRGLSLPLFLSNLRGLSPLPPPLPPHRIVTNTRGLSPWNIRGLSLSDHLGTPRGCPSRPLLTAGAIESHAFENHSRRKTTGNGPIPQYDETVHLDNRKGCPHQACKQAKRRDLSRLSSGLCRKRRPVHHRDEFPQPPAGRGGESPGESCAGLRDERLAPCNVGPARQLGHPQVDELRRP